MLADELKKIINDKDLQQYRMLIQDASNELDVDHLQCAAALAYLYQNKQQEVFQNKPSTNNKTPENSKAVTDFVTSNKIKMVRYRLEVGRKHQIAINDLKKLLVDETGVEKKNIGYIEMFKHYTLVKLPEGMPTDIYQHLKTVEIKQQLLQIKRVRTTSKRKNGTEKKSMHRRVRKNTINNRSATPASKTTLVDTISPDL